MEHYDLHPTRQAASWPWRSVNKSSHSHLEEASDMLSTLDATLRWLCNCLLFLQIMQQRQGEIGGPAESHTAKM